MKSDAPEHRTRIVRAGIELLVIAIGVFLGLAADGWRDALRARRDEAEYLRRLRTDLEYDTAGLASEVRERAAVTEVLARLSAGEVGPAPDPQRLADDLAQATRWSWTFRSTHSVTFDEMVSTGRLALIRDAGLRAAVAEYYALYRGRVATVEARRGDFNALSYGLVPRSLPPNDVSLEDVEFDFKAGSLSGSQREQLLAPTVQREIQFAATAQLNFLRWSTNRAALLHRRGAELLDRLETYEGR